MPQYRFSYFDFMAFGEPIRLMLSYMGKDFEDRRFSWKDWPQLKKKENTPFGKLPMLEFDGRVLHQSLAILKYLAIEVGLAGNNAEENLEIDMIVGAFGDLAAEISRYYRMESPDEKEKLKRTITDELIPFYMSKLETILKNNGGYLANGKLSWAEFFVVGYSGSIPGIVGLDIMEKYPFFKDLVDRVHSLPGVKEWIKKRPATPL